MSIEQNVIIYIPRDSTSLSMGAGQVVAKLQQALATGSHPQKVTIIRNGSRGLYWLEPMLEVETTAGRVAYGPVTPKDIDKLSLIHI